MCTKYVNKRLIKSILHWIHTKLSPENLILSVANAPLSTIDDIISSMIFLQRNGNVAVFFYPNANSMVYQGICFNKITCSYSFNI